MNFIIFRNQKKCGMGMNVSSAVLLGLLVCADCAAGEETLRNRCDLALPLVSEKRVVAHYMSNMLYSDEADSVPTYDTREHFRLDGPSGPIGGFNQSFPVMDFRGSGSDIDQAAEFELRAALEAGIGGFAFYYPMASDGLLQRFNLTVKAFFRAVRRTGTDFKLTVCLCSPEGSSSKQEKIRIWGDSLKELLENREWDDIWLKRPDGALVIYLWNCEGLADEVYGVGDILKNPSLAEHDAIAYEELASYCGIRAAYLYHVRWWMLKNRKLINELVDFYPAFWSWIPLNSLYGKQWDAFAKTCMGKNRIYTETICPDFYTSKLFKKEGEMMYDRVWELEDALALGVDGMWRWVFVSDLSGEFRASAERAVQLDVPLLNIATWNDYPEGHQVCPDVNKNFAFFTLLRYFANVWQGYPERNEKEIGWVFYKKYPSSVRPSIADFEVRSEENIPLSREDFIEAVVFVRKPAQLFLNGKDLGSVSPGLSVRRISIETGPVRLQAVRNGETVFEFTAPEWITAEPYRTDRATVGYSSECRALWTELFGNKPPVSACEYAEELPGVPNWKRGKQLTDEKERVQ